MAHLQITVGNEANHCISQIVGRKGSIDLQGAKLFSIQWLQQRKAFGLDVVLVEGLIQLDERKLTVGAAAMLVG